MDKGSPQAMLVAATTRFSAGIQAGYGLALHVDDLGPPVDPETTVRIVPDRIERRGVERRSVDLVHGCILSTRELGIATLVHVRVPLGHRVLQVCQRNPLELMARVNFGGQFLDRVGAEEEAIGRRSEGRIDVPLVTLTAARSKIAQIGPEK